MIVVDHLIEIAFKGNRKEFFLWEGEEPPPLRAAVIVDADRGEDLGRVHSTGELAQKRVAGVPHAPGPEGAQKRVRRLATSEDVQKHDELRAQDESARRRAMERVKANNLLMKLSDAEWQWDRRKLTIYFTAEKRVDFRNLVRDLAALFRTRIELKQIGVRDEAKRLSGIGRCGREYCSASWLPELRPVNLGVAKEQRLSLNPSQISGACGRLMCCLRYEHEFYVQQRKRFPKEGKVITTTKGQEKVIVNDIFRERVTLRVEDGETRILALTDLRLEMGGDRVQEPTGEQEAFVAQEDVPEEVIRLMDTVELPVWVPRSPDSSQATSSSRQLPVAPSSGSTQRTDRVNITADPEPEDGSDINDDDEGAEGDAGEDDSAPQSSTPVDAGARPERRRRRRGRRGGRRNRGPDRRGGDGSPGGGGAGGPADGGGGGGSPGAT